MRSNSRRLGGSTVRDQAGGAPDWQARQLAAAAGWYRRAAWCRTRAEALGGGSPASPPASPSRRPSRSPRLSTRRAAYPHQHASCSNAGHGAGAHRRAEPGPPRHAHFGFRGRGAPGGTRPRQPGPFALSDLAGTLLEEAVTLTASQPGRTLRDLTAAESQDLDRHGTIGKLAASAARRSCSVVGISSSVTAAAREDRGDPLDQVGDERAPPGAPGGRAGGQRVGLGERVQQFQGARRADGLGDRADGRRVVQVAPGGGVDEQQVVAYERGERRPRPARSKPIRAATSRAMISPATEWSPGQPLPMSCSSAAISSRSGRPTRRVRLGGPHGGLDRGAGRRSSCARRCAAAGSAPAPSRAAAG